MSENLNNYLNLLNNQQRLAVENTDGALLVLAGAGSGKTRVLTYKILHLLDQRLALPNQILAVTFTNKAAVEMKNRVASLLRYPVDKMWVGTFHSISAKILRSHADLVGLKSNFVIIDSDDQLKLIKKICERESIDLKERAPKYFVTIINGYKNKGLFPCDIKVNKFNKNGDIIKIYTLYQEELLRLNCVDFGDLILHCLDLIKNNKDVSLKYQKFFKYILVDEYQDINNVQQKWLEVFFEGHKNICCVGDDDQSIYSWRGADVNNLLNFEKIFTKPEIIRLEQNYRSTKNILECASTLIKKNQGRYGKDLWSENEQGEKISVNGFWQTKEESIYVSDEIEKMISKKIPLSEISLLFRVSAHTRSFEDRFINLGLPYKIIGGVRFYERKEIKDVIAYLRLINNPNDDLALERIINIPKRGIGKTTLSKISTLARLNNSSMLEAAAEYTRDSSSKINIEINDFIVKVNKWIDFKKKMNHIELVQLILEDSKYIEYIESEERASKNPESLNRLENIKEFIESLSEFENLEGFLEHVSLVMENITNTSDQTITLMTMHGAKGLEFDNIFLIGWEEGVFPSKRSIDELGKTGLEEERRLAYVAITRARKKIFITYVNQNRYSYASHDFNIPSRFIGELPKDLIDIVDSSYFRKNDFIDEFSQIENINNDFLSPGRKRLLSKTNENEINWDFDQDIDQTNDNFSLEGARVFHQKYGYGTLLNYDGEKANVKFDKSDLKHIFIKYLQFKH
jgi:DNA helicase-2/ATP-dependent DNA helicase PcrA